MSEVNKVNKTCRLIQRKRGQIYRKKDGHGLTFKRCAFQISFFTMQLFHIFLLNLQRVAQGITIHLQLMDCGGVLSSCCVSSCTCTMWAAGSSDERRTAAWRRGGRWRQRGEHGGFISNTFLISHLYWKSAEASLTSSGESCHSTRWHPHTIKQQSLSSADGVSHYHYYTVRGFSSSATSTNMWSPKRTYFISF